MSMYLAPHIVKAEHLAKGEIKGYPYILNPGGGGRKINYPYSFDAVTANGRLSDVTQATPEKGEARLSACLDWAAEFLDDYIW